jgi:zinc transport system ATP-binding protein
MMNQPMIDVSHLSVRCGGQTVLNDLSFTIKKGEVVAVVGPNGSGKSMLMRAILGLVPHSGKVLIDGKPARDVLQRVGYVPQRFEWDRTIPITVKEFLSIPFPKIQPRDIQRVLLEVDLPEYENRLLGTLSGGQLQRMLIARALVNDPPLVILDEATSGIDMAGAKSFHDIITHLRQVHHATVILVSHEINMVYEFSDQIICLNRDIICHGKPNEALTREVLEKLYGKGIKLKEHRH